ncbi:MAG: DUF1015 domain-containing protein [Chitinophagales bacterium]|jgi:uncharacterized protein (DUF1015 family)|nr:DUF1015 domain-containing protein [Chitinophagales bacterium]MBP9190897.1 DUF1015 domain-containing protein [Chitinophagales bacterium]MBP9796257.1 DUF1015 domain-containing protein [Chitinophagales bacterium]
MAIINPFKGWRPKPELAELVASRPYDVLNSEEAREEAAGNAVSFLHVCKPEIDLPENIDHYADAVYAKAVENWKRFQSDGTFNQDNKPCLYAYRQIMNGHAQIGLVANSSIEDYFNDIIKKHEFTRPDKENDRIRHMYELQCHPEPVFLTYPDVAAVDTIINEVVSTNAPINDFTAEDGIQHTFWVIDNDKQIDALVNLFQQSVPFTYIADGHHRSASSAKVGKRMGEANPNHTGKEEYNFFLSVIFPASQLMIMDYNRVIIDLNGHSKEDIIAALENNFIVERSVSTYKPENLHNFGMYIDNEWYKLTAKENTYDNNDPIAVLDVTILSNHILDPIFNIKDQRTDKRIDFVGGIRGLGELEKRVNSGEMKIAFSLYPVSIQQLINIADSGNVMPPKSTWFEPKLRSGLVVHTF